MIIGFLLAIIGHAGLYFVGNDINLMLPCWVIGNIGQGIACSMPFAMLSDTVDYNEWKTGMRASGFLTAIGSAFCIKAGAGIGGFIPAMIMGAFGYIPNAVQDATSLMGIRFVFTWMPAILFAIGIIPMLLYRRYERQEHEIIAELAQR